MANPHSDIHHYEASNPVLRPPSSHSHFQSDNRPPQVAVLASSVRLVVRWARTLGLPSIDDSVISASLLSQHRFHWNLFAQKVQKALVGRSVHKELSFTELSTVIAFHLLSVFGKASHSALTIRPVHGSLPLRVLDHMLLILATTWTCTITIWSPHVPMFQPFGHEHEFSVTNSKLSWKESKVARYQAIVHLEEDMQSVHTIAIQLDQPTTSFDLGQHVPRLHSDSNFAIEIMRTGEHNWLLVREHRMRWQRRQIDFLLAHFRPATWRFLKRLRTKERFIQFKFAQHQYIGGRWQVDIHAQVVSRHR